MSFRKRFRRISRVVFSEDEHSISTAQDRKIPLRRCYLNCVFDSTFTSHSEWNRLNQLLQKYQQEREVLNQLNLLTSMREKIERLIKETSKKV